MGLSLGSLGVMRASLPFKLIVVTLTAAVAAYYLIASVKVGGLAPYDSTAADVIQKSCPFHVVPAAWVSGRDQADILVRWSFAEIMARLAVLITLLVLTVSTFVWQHLRRRSRPEAF